MAFNKMTTNVENVSALPDVVSEQSSLLKNTFDKAGKDLKAFINTLIDELGSETSAANLGATKEGVATTVQEYLDNLSNSIGDKTSITVNGEKQEEVSIYAPTTSGNINQILRGNENGEPQWADAPDGIIVDSTLSETSTNAIQNAVVTKALKGSTKLYKYQVTIPAEGWSDTKEYYVDVAIEGILKSDLPSITPIYTDVKETNIEIQEAYNKIDSIKTYNGYIRVVAFKEIPTREIPIQIKVVR